MSPILLLVMFTPTVPARLPSLQAVSSRSSPSLVLPELPLKHSASLAPTVTTAKTTHRRERVKAVTLLRQRDLPLHNSPTALVTSPVVCKTLNLADKVPLNPRLRHSVFSSNSNNLSRSLRECQSSSRSYAAARLSILPTGASCHLVHPRCHLTLFLLLQLLFCIFRLSTLSAASTILTQRHETVKRRERIHYKGHLHCSV
jgi:hypothetical protein